MNIIEKYKKGKRDFQCAYLSGANLRDADLFGANLRDANLSGANLSNANLFGANLRDANLFGANLSGANLSDANLFGANLSDADLSGANLSGANLSGANLRSANLRGANLRDVNLSDANLRDANLPAPTAMMLARWGAVSDNLCVELMRFDAANHPDPAAFDRWADGGDCPYENIKLQRCVRFRESRRLWSPGPSKSALELMRLLILEKCSDSDYHKHELANE